MDDENGPIGKLNKITGKIGNSFIFNYDSDNNDSINIRDLISTSIDRLDNDNKLHIGLIIIRGTYICLAQKHVNSDYASGLVFGYYGDKILYQRKRDGAWQPIREI